MPIRFLINILNSADERKKQINAGVIVQEKKEIRSTQINLNSSNTSNQEFTKKNVNYGEKT